MNRSSYRKLNDKEIKDLKQNRCHADNWNDIYVKDGFNTESVYDCRFSGKIELGVFNKIHFLKGGIKQPSGIYNATLHNCSVGDDVVIYNTREYIASYSIGDGTIIRNIGTILCDRISSFGQGVMVAVLNETGGREVPIYNNLSAHTAYIIALYRHRKDLINRLYSMIDEYAQQYSSNIGTIGKECHISGCSSIINCNIGDYTKIENTTRLVHGTINSCKEAPVCIGDSVIAEEFIVSSGATVSDAAKLVRCFVGQSSHISHNFSAHDSLLFSNCTLENGEACAIFGGPFTVSMHKSSLLIAGMFSFLNAGSGSNQSNHMYKLGPIHQGIVERGSKTTSDSYILWPARVGAFSLVMGRHHHHSDTSDMPFSYILEGDDETYLVPAINLRSVGTIRDAQKWPKRDKRTDKHHIDKINYNLLSPYTISKMMRGRESLEMLKKVSGETSHIYYYQNTRIKGEALAKAITLYDMGITKFLGNSLIKKLETTKFKDIGQLREQLKPTEQFGCGEWIDLSGLILPKDALDGMLSDIETGVINTLTQVEEFFGWCHSNYYSLEWNWAYHQIERYFDLDMQSISAARITEIVRCWQKAVITLDQMLYEDAKKEFSLSSMIGFGVDGGRRDRRNDFESVRGDFESNPFVVAVEDHISEKRALGEELIDRISHLV